MTQTMTCTECLSLVATADVSELTTAGLVRDHCRSCADCARVVDEVAEEAGRLADLLDGTLPGVPAHVVALRAVAGSAPGRRRARQRRSALLLGALVATPLVALLFARLVVPAPGIETNVELQCLSPAQAAELARVTLPPELEVSMLVSSRLPILTIRGADDDIAAATRLIEQLDARWAAERSASCEGAPGAGAPAAPPAAASTPAAASAPAP